MEETNRFDLNEVICALGSLGLIIEVRGRIDDSKDLFYSCEKGKKSCCWTMKAGETGFNMFVFFQQDFPEHNEEILVKSISHLKDLFL